MGNLHEKVYLYKLYNRFNVESIEDVIHNFKMEKNKNEGLRSIFQNLNKEMRDLIGEENAYQRELDEINSLIKINVESYVHLDEKVNSIVAQNIHNEITELKESNIQIEKLFNQKDENLRKIIGSISNYDIKLQNLMNIINIFEIINAKSFSSLNSNRNNDKNDKFGHIQHTLQNSLLIQQSNIIKKSSTHHTPVIKFKQNNSTSNLVKLHIKIKNIKDWLDTGNFKILVQFIMKFQWKLYYLSNVVFTNFLLELTQDRTPSHESTNSPVNVNRVVKHVPMEIHKIFSSKLKPKYEEYLLNLINDLRYNKSVLKKDTGVQNRIKNEIEKIA